MGAPRAPSRPLRTYIRTLPSGRQLGSWWPSGGVSAILGMVDFLEVRSYSWRTTSLTDGFGRSETIARVVPSGDTTGSRIQDCHVCPFWDTLPFRTRTGSALPSALTCITLGVVRA